MQNKKSLLFLTNFSEACFQAIPALAEWADHEEAQLSLLHVHSPGRAEELRAQKAMQSFFAEADRYAKCERLLLPGDAETQIVSFCRERRPEIVFAPANHPTGIPRMRHRSLRASLLRKSNVKIWSRGRNGSRVPRKAPENVAYVVSGHANWHSEATMAAQTAARYGAQFHMIYLTPHQVVHDGTVAADIRIGHASLVEEELAALTGSLPMEPVVHSSTGDEFRELPRLLEESHASMVFLGERHAIRRGVFGYSVNRDLESMDCEFVCFPERGMAAEKQLDLESPGTYRLLPELP
jgi:hypothetical protein